MTVCCEHNPCPDRPEWFLRRFVHRPWFCTQCGRFWITKPTYNWAELEYEWYCVGGQP